MFFQSQAFAQEDLGLKTYGSWWDFPFFVDLRLLFTPDGFANGSISARGADAPQDACNLDQWLTSGRSMQEGQASRRLPFSESRLYLLGRA